MQSKLQHPQLIQASRATPHKQRKCTLRELYSGLTNMNKAVLQIRFLVRRRELMLFLAIFMVVLTQPACGNTNKRLDKSCENGVCYREEDQGPCIPNDDEPRLFRWEPIQVLLPGVMSIY